MTGTINALGTSLSELPASIITVKKGEHDIAIGNVVGSNMFNIFGVIGIAGAIEPLPKISPEVFLHLLSCGGSEKEQTFSILHQSLFC